MNGLIYMRAVFYRDIWMYVYIYICMDIYIYRHNGRNL